MSHRPCKRILGGLSWPKIRFAIWKLTKRLLSSNLSMQVRHTIFAQQNAKNNLNLGQNNMHVLHKKFGVPVSDGTPFVGAEN